MSEGVWPNLIALIRISDLTDSCPYTLHDINIEANTAGTIIARNRYFRKISRFRDTLINNNLVP
jgi:hypothetical protein